MWQPIATAPRDGTKFLAGQWTVEDGQPVFDYEVLWWSTSWGFGGGGNVTGPSVWMPLPAPPKHEQ